MIYLTISGGSIDGQRVYRGKDGVLIREDLTNIHLKYLGDHKFKLTFTDRVTPNDESEGITYDLSSDGEITSETSFTLLPDTNDGPLKFSGTTAEKNMAMESQLH